MAGVTLTNLGNARDLKLGFIINKIDLKVCETVGNKQTLLPQLNYPPINTALFHF